MDWTRKKASWLVVGLRETYSDGDPDFVLDDEESEACAEKALNDARNEERKALLARLREPDEELLVQIVALCEAQPEPDGGALECVATVLACLAAALDPSPPPGETREEK